MRVHAAYLLGLAASVAMATEAAMAMAVHPLTTPQTPVDMLDLPLDPGVVGPRCPLQAWSPVQAQEGVWILPPHRQVLPYELVEAGYPDTPRRAHDLIVLATCTAYSSTCDQTDSTPFLTASMQPVRPGIIALSRDLLRRYTPGAPFAFGDYVEIVGVGVFRVEDTMHRRWQRRADIWVRSRAEARQWGRREVLIGAIEGDAEVRVLESSPLIADEPAVDTPGLEVELLIPEDLGETIPAILPASG